MILKVLALSLFSFVALGYEIGRLVFTNELNPNYIWLLTIVVSFGYTHHLFNQLHRSSIR